MTAWSLRLTEARSGLDVTIELLEKKRRRTSRSCATCWPNRARCPRFMPYGRGRKSRVQSRLPWCPRVGGSAAPSRECDADAATGGLGVGVCARTDVGRQSSPIFDLGVFYGPGARMLFPIGWLAGSVIGKVLPQDLAALTEGCIAIRQQGACTLRFEAK